MKPNPKFLLELQKAQKQMSDRKSASSDRFKSVSSSDEEDMYKRVSDAESDVEFELLSPRLKLKPLKEEEEEDKSEDDFFQPTRERYLKKGLLEKKVEDLPIVRTSGSGYSLFKSSKQIFFNLIEIDVDKLSDSEILQEKYFMYNLSQVSLMLHKLCTSKELSYKDVYDNISILFYHLESAIPKIKSTDFDYFRITEGKEKYLQCFKKLFFGVYLPYLEFYINLSENYKIQKEIEKYSGKTIEEITKIIQNFEPFFTDFVEKTSKRKDVIYRSNSLMYIFMILYCFFYRVLFAKRPTYFTTFTAIMGKVDIDLRVDFPEAKLEIPKSS